MTEITKKERTIMAIFDEMLRYMSPNVSCKVRVGALGRRDFVLFKTYQHTLHDYGELGIDLTRFTGIMRMSIPSMTCSSLTPRARMVGRPRWRTPYYV